MGLLKSALIGIFAGIIFSITLELFGALCLCCPGAPLSLLFGYLVAMLAKVRNKDYKELALNVIVLALVASLISVPIYILLTQFNINLMTLLGYSAGAAVLQSAGWVGIVINFILVFLTLLLGGFIGGIVYMYTGASKM